MVQVPLHHINRLLYLRRQNAQVFVNMIVNRFTQWASVLGSSACDLSMKQQQCEAVLPWFPTTSVIFTDELLPEAAS